MNYMADPQIWSSGTLGGRWEGTWWILISLIAASAYLCVALRWMH